MRRTKFAFKYPKCFSKMSDRLNLQDFIHFYHTIQLCRIISANLPYLAKYTSFYAEITICNKMVYLFCVVFYRGESKFYKMYYKSISERQKTPLCFAKLLVLVLIVL